MYDLCHRHAIDQFVVKVSVKGVVLDQSVSTVGAVVEATRVSQYAKWLQLGRGRNCESVVVGRIHKQRA